MMKRIIISFVIIFTLVSCNLDDGASPNYRIETLTVKTAEVPDSFEFGSTHILKVTFDLPSGCHVFFDLYYQYEGTARIVAINSLVNENPTVACTDVVTEASHSFEVKVTQVEDYTFKFWKGRDDNGDDIFEEVVVPVIEP